MTDLAEDDDEPLSLEEACNAIFRGRITPATLRSEAARGRLTIERIGRKDFVTRAGIREMRQKCQVAPLPKDQDYGLNPPGSGPTARLPSPDGALETTADTSIALASALRSVEALKKLSGTTLPRNTRSRRASLTLVKD